MLRKVRFDECLACALTQRFARHGRETRLHGLTEPPLRGQPPTQCLQRPQTKLVVRLALHQHPVFGPVGEEISGQDLLVHFGDFVQPLRRVEHSVGECFAFPMVDGHGR